MFESAEIGHKIDKKTWRKEEPKLRAELLDAQFDLREARRFPVLILINGLDGAGKGEIVNLLNAWMDPRHIETHAFPPPDEEERARPPAWRFWQALPPKGNIGIFVGNWYTEPIVARVHKAMGRAELDRSVADILRLEGMLADEGILLIKYWFHLSKRGQKARLQKLESDPKTSWRVTRHDWALFAEYDKYVKTSGHVLRLTSTASAPWIVVDGSDEYHRSLTVGRHLLQAVKGRLVATAPGQAAPVRKSARKSAPLTHALDGKDLINSLDLTQHLDKKKYDDELVDLQGRLNILSRNSRFRDHSLILVFEGNDAAGKGGAIRRVTASLDARMYKIVPVAAPTEEARAQPYLWRFWRHVPGRGRLVIFDRSWYGRVLVERVEGFASESDWMRAYAEINDFEDQLARNGAIILKFWLAISAEQQLARFKEREQIPFKRFKITDEDWRNRKKWDDYEVAVCDMVDRTSTEHAPWILVEANDKNFARIKVMRTICERLEAQLAKD
jgi:AMP-polyphosphate phosphotransferase